VIVKENAVNGLDADKVFTGEARDKSRLGEATDIAAKAVAQRFGTGSVDGKIQAHVVTIEC